MRQRILFVTTGLVLGAGLGLGGCAQAPGVGDTTTPGVPASSIASVPSPSEAGPPTSFDTDNAVEFQQGDWPGVLDGQVYYAADSTATLWAMDVTTGQSKFNVHLTSQDGGGGSNWACPAQVVDANNVYTIVSNYSDQEVPVVVELTATDKQSGDVLWRYLPEITVPAEATDCGVLLDYTMTPTPAGLLLTLSQWDAPHGRFNSSSAMLDATTGDELWQTDTLVQAATGTESGVQLSDAGVAVVDLKTGQAGPLVITTPAMDGYWKLSGYSLAGQAGDNIVVTRLDVQSHSVPQSVNLPSRLTVFQIAAGQLASQTPLVLTTGDLGNCQVDGAILVCTGYQDPLTATGISLADGTSLWQTRYARSDCADAPPPLVLFGGYLYAANDDGGFVLDTSTGSVAKGAWGRPVAVSQSGMVFEADNTTAAPTFWWAPAS